jgi:tRNA-2-methylthio-N6-dimethylallyladenosine synthase
VNVLENPGEIVEGLPSKRMFRFKAYVDIMRGCNNFCTYCIVPFTRGQEMSRDTDKIVREIKDLVNEGVLEVTLLGQNVNSYKGGKPGGGHVGFAELLTMIEGIDGLERVRFMTSHPKDLDQSTIDLYRDRDSKLCPAIHLPVQSGSSRILELMNRKYSKEDYLLLVQKLREANPDIVITTDFIVGFPGETEKDFSETMDLIDRVGFDSAFTFIYSPRIGTPAADIEAQVPEDVKHNRFNRMIGRLNEITLEKNRAYIGQTFGVLVEGVSKTSKDMLNGRTAGGKLVNFPCNRSAIGTTVQVKITDVNTFSFIGETI